MTPRLTLFTLSTLACAGAGGALAQGLPTTQPALVTIVREQVKLGRGADHARIEAGWPAAFAKAKSSSYYLAFASLTGEDEVWFVTPYASEAALGADMKLADSDTVLAAELSRLARADADVLTGHRTVQATARPDLSFGAFPDLAKQRFWEITTFRVRPGHEMDFEAAAKAYGTATQRAAPSSSYRIYAVTAGLPGPTYIVFSSVVAYADFDAMTAAGQKTMQMATPEEMAVLRKFSTEGSINVETNRYRLDPAMSYVSSETRASDPAFWTPRRQARRP